MYTFVLFFVRRKVKKRFEGSSDSKKSYRIFGGFTSLKNLQPDWVDFAPPLSMDTSEQCSGVSAPGPC